LAQQPSILAALRRAKKRYDRYSETPGALSRYQKILEVLKTEFVQFRKHAPVRRPIWSSRAALPSIIVASLPKSGTKYISSTIKQTLDCRLKRSLYKGRFPRNTVLPHMAAEFAKGGLVLACHLSCSGDNMRVLAEHGLKKLVLHVRDPRACAYSWFHYYRQKPTILARAKPSPEAFLALSDEQQIEHHIGAFFANCVAWLSAWSDFLDANPDTQILVTSHDRLATDPQGFFEEILQFYGIAADRVLQPMKDAGVNFRSGDRSEWRRSIAPAQIERMTAMMPQRLFDRFGWPA
jgi:hypothetical protein